MGWCQVMYVRILLLLIPISFHCRGISTILVWSVCSTSFSRVLVQIKRKKNYISCRGVMALFLTACCPQLRISSSFKRSISSTTVLIIKEQPYWLRSRTSCIEQDTWRLFFLFSTTSTHNILLLLLRATRRHHVLIAYWVLLLMLMVLLVMMVSPIELSWWQLIVITVLKDIGWGNLSTTLFALFHEVCQILLLIVLLLLSLSRGCGSWLRESSYSCSWWFKQIWAFSK